MSLVPGSPGKSRCHWLSYCPVPASVGGLSNEGDFVRTPLPLPPLRASVLDPHIRREDLEDSRAVNPPPLGVVELPGEPSQPYQASRGCARPGGGRDSLRRGAALV